IGGVIAAGLDGIHGGLEPPDPVQVHPATLSDDERAALGVPPLPSSQEEARDALEGDAVLAAALGPVLAGSYLAVRRSEGETYAAEDDAFEQQGHFEKYCARSRSSTTTLTVSSRTRSPATRAGGCSQRARTRPSGRTSRRGSRTCAGSPRSRRCSAA